MKSLGRPQVFEVTTFLSERTDLYHSSLLLSGMCSLNRRGAIRLRLAVPPEPNVGALTDFCGLCAELADGPRRRLAVFDLHDSSAQFALPQLERCDVYFKRSFFRPDLSTLAPTLRGKVRPLGLNHACRSSDCWYAVLRALAPRLTWAAARPLLQGVTCSALGIVEQLKRFLQNPAADSLEQGPDVPLLPAIVFQTRVWEAGETGAEDWRSFNDWRVAVLRALRVKFAGQFRGGLVPTAFALKQYPGDITGEPSRRSQYLRMSKQNLIGIYTRGIHHSLAFKLSEYLAASQCIVSEPLRNELPAPLIEGVNYLSFRTPDDCVAACAKLLNDPALAARMRQANFEYYRRHLQPPVHVYRCLEEAFCRESERNPVAA